MVQSDIDQSRVTAGLFNAGVDVNTTPDKLTSLKLKTLNDEQDARSEAGGLPQFGGRASVLRAGGGRRISGAQSVIGGSRTVQNRSSRLITSGGSRRQSSFLANHRSRMSADLTAQAESKFTTLIELMTSASREASSFKEYWLALMADRESFDREREELMLQIDELTVQTSERDDEQDVRNRELGDARGEVEKLLAIINVSKDSNTEHEKRLAERDSELDRSRKDYSILQASFSSQQLHYDTLKAELEAKNVQLRDRESERDSAIHDGERQRSDNRNLARELADARNKNTDLQSQLEAARKEVLHLTERTRTLEHERSELLYEKDRLQDELKRANARVGEITRELEDLTTKYDTIQRDINNLRTTLRTTESERDEHVTVIERLRHEIKDKTTRLGHTESYVSDLNLRLEQAKREVTTTNEKLSHITVEIETLKTTLSDRQDALRLVNIERDNLKDDVETERRKVIDIQRTVTNLQDQALRTENTTSELRAEAIKLNETIRETKRSRDEARQRHGPFEKEIAILKEKLALALRQHGESIDARDCARRELDEFKVQYEETIESIESYQESGQELEFEIESLRTLLAEAREQKERAISARNSADRERDQSIAAFEEKCRQLEKFEEQKISQFHSLQKSEGNRQSGSSRIVSRSTVTHHGGHSSSEHHGGHGSIAHHHHHGGHEHGNGEAKDEEL